MKRYCMAAILLGIATVTNATVKDSTILYTLPDSVKAVQYMAEVSVNGFNNKKFCSIGIRTDAVEISIQRYYQWRLVGFRSLKDPSHVITLGIGAEVDRKAPYPNFRFELQAGEPYKLLIAQATDSAGNYSLYSGYIFLPKENKWKLIGTLRIDGRWNTLQQPAVVYTNRDKQDKGFMVKEAWVQRNNGSWKNLDNKTLLSPTINLFGHADSVQQRQVDIKIIREAMATGKTDVKENVEGVYYNIMKEGTGKPVLVTDTVVAWYKGYLFSDGSVFDQTRDKPASFPLQRLIKGWQVGLAAACKVGGKIKLVIPSDLAYSIRTRSAKIPPNSILVFEIEVVETRPKQ